MYEFLPGIRRTNTFPVIGCFAFDGLSAPTYGFSPARVFLDFPPVHFGLRHPILYVSWDRSGINEHLEQFFTTESLNNFGLALSALMAYQSCHKRGQYELGLAYKIFYLSYSMIAKGKTHFVFPPNERDLLGWEPCWCWEQIEITPSLLSLQ